MSGDLPEELLDIDTEDIFGGEGEGGDQEVEPEETERVIIFELGGQLFAAPVMEVTQVVEPTELTRVPRTARAVDGIMDMRGEIVAILNPWIHLTIDREPFPWDEQLVAVFTTRGDEQPIGIRIDDVVGVEVFPVGQITFDVGPEDEGPNTRNPLVQGVITREQSGEGTERIALLDTDAIIDASGQHPTETSGATAGR